MTRTALKPAYQPATRPATAAPSDLGSLDTALHPMHQELLERWTAPVTPLEAKFSPRARLAIVMFGATLSWAVVIGAGWGISSLF